MRKVFGRYAVDYLCAKCHHTKGWHRKRKADTRCEYPDAHNNPCPCAAYEAKKT